MLVNEYFIKYRNLKIYYKIIEFFLGGENLLYNSILLLLLIR